MKSYDVRDERANEWIAITIPPLVVMIGGHKEQVIRAMRRNEGMIFPHSDPEIYLWSSWSEPEQIDPKQASAELITKTVQLQEERFWLPSSRAGLDNIKTLSLQIRRC